MRVTLLILLCLLVSSCHTDSKIQVEQPDSTAIATFPVVLDTMDLEKYGLKESERTSNWRSHASYDILYIGIPSDTLFVNHFLGYYPPPPLAADAFSEDERSPKPHPMAGYYRDWLDLREYLLCDRAIVDISIDTTLTAGNTFPVLLTNLESDTIEIAYGDDLSLIMEAKDSTGAWKPIEERSMYMCGTGVGWIILPPNEVVLTFAPRYEGDYETDLRLSLGNNYSPTFAGSIHYTQFESRIDADGNFKEQRSLEMEME